MRHAIYSLSIALALVGCGNTEEAPAVVYPSPVVTRIEVATTAPTPIAVAPARSAISVDAIVVTTKRSLDRPTEVVGVIDEHEKSGRQDAAFELLRRRAAAMGADAVVGAEFHHGDEEGGATHLSGLAVRYLDHLRPGEWP